MKISELLLPTAKQMLNALSGQLGKAAENVASGQIAEEELLDARIAPDMFPLSRQINLTCVQPLQALARLKGEELGAAEEVGSLADAQTLIARTIATLDAANAEQMDAAADRTTVMNLPNGMVFSLSGADYVRDWSLPQFYFHLMASYALLRQSGVAIGKADYVPHMARYAVRP